MQSLSWPRGCGRFDNHRRLRLDYHGSRNCSADRKLDVLIKECSDLASHWQNCTGSGDKEAGDRHERDRSHDASRAGHSLVIEGTS